MVAMADTVERYSRGTRWFHAGVYLTVLVTLATGWWFLIDGYRHESPLARLTGLPDATVHEYAGYGLGLVMLIWLAHGARGLRSFVRETLRYRPGDGRWLAGLARAVVTGRFGDHDGHFDPGQRLANVAMLLTLATLLLSGLVMILLPFHQLFSVHHWAALLATPVIVGHIIVAAGLLPGYRGVWRSMHLGGRLPVEVARRIWPVWLDTHLRPDTRRDRPQP
jgi:cytochrome b subunit of formate dehydrogenase